MNDLIIKINGQSYGGWKIVEITRSIEQITSSFRIESANNFPGKPDNWNIKNGDFCVLEIDGHKIISGYIDTISIDYDGENQIFSLSGRDKTADLVDCSYIGNNELLEQTVQSIIETLCSPFDISIELGSIVVDSDLAKVLEQKIDVFETDQGDSVFSLITKLTKTRGILPISTGDGKLFLTRAGNNQANDSLETGINILSCSFVNDDRDRFSNYWVKSQSGLTDELDLQSAFQAGGQVVDKKIQRNRPLIILSDDELDIGQAELTAQWESKRRAARSRKITYTTQGWVQSNRAPWTPNELVRVKDEVLNIDTSLLIVSVIYKLDEKADGMITELLLSHKEGYEVFESSVEEIFNDFDKPNASIETIPVQRYIEGVFESP